VPLSAAEEYKRVMKSARLSVFDNCGHRPEIEKPADFLREVEGFLS
jgi:pimeloyl-ACP methyl ester carboxylesterase